VLNLGHRWLLSAKRSTINLPHHSCSITNTDDRICQSSWFQQFGLLFYHSPAECCLLLCAGRLQLPCCRHLPYSLPSNKIRETLDGVKQRAASTKRRQLPRILRSRRCWLFISKYHCCGTQLRLIKDLCHPTWALWRAPATIATNDLPDQLDSKHPTRVDAHLPIGPCQCSLCPL